MPIKNSALNFSYLTIRLLFFLCLSLTPVLLKGQGIRTRSEAEAAMVKLRRLGQTENKVDLLIDFSSYYLNLPDEQKADLTTAMGIRDQAFVLATKIEYPKGIARSMVLKGNILRESGDKMGSSNIYRQVLAYANKMQLKDELAETNIAIGNLLSNEGDDLERKIGYNEEALVLYRQSGNRLEEGNTLKNLGDYYNIKSQPAYAMKLMDESLAVYKAIGFKELQGVYIITCVSLILALVIIRMR